jgi:proteasome lid subunit RPN8/RPN11
MSRLEIPVLLWWRMIQQLRKRGGGEHESGAFLLAKTGSRRVNRFICYDDLDETALDSGIVRFHAHGFVHLWDICQREKLKVVADVHTHPAGWTGQSESDRTHPMIAQPGHIALILPHFAQRTKRSLNGAGIYEYLGNHVWKTCSAKLGPVKITLL